MSQTKKFKIQIALLLMLVSFFMFGCKNETPVEDIYFNLNPGEQIVLIAGQTLDLNEYVVVKPSYATNKKFNVTSFNEDAVRVDGTKLIAVKEDQALIKVSSKDNPLKECMMTVVVKATQEQLIAPLNLNYNMELQTFNFDPVTYASSYTLNINGEEIELGNSTSFSLKDYSGKKFDDLLIVKVRANAPTYSYALKTSDYSSEYKVYQAGTVSNLRVEAGVVKFDKHSANNKHNVYLDDELFANNLGESHVSIKALDEKFAGKALSVNVETIVDETIKQQYGADVHYFNSLQQSVDINVLDVPNIELTSSTLAWQNVAHAAGYAILIDGEKKSEVKNNYFDLHSLSDYDVLITSTNVHQIKVMPILASNSVGVGQTIKENLVKVQRLTETALVCDGTNISWEQIDGASVYSIKLVGEGVELVSSTNQTSFSMDNYLAGKYQFEITVVAHVAPSEEGVYYLSSKPTVKNFIKHETLSAQIENYALKINNLDGGVAKIDFDVDAFDKTINGTAGQTTIVDMSQYVFDAGEHSITLTLIGDENSIDSDELTIEFTQLEKIENISISNGVVSVARSVINEKANIKLVTTGGVLADPIEIVNTGYVYNTENLQHENYLAAGEYVTKVYVEGDGCATFSYRENNVVVSCAEVRFDVLSAPNAELQDPAVQKISIESIENAQSYDVYNIDADNGAFVKNIPSNEFIFTLNVGKVAYAFKTIGDGVRYLNSCISEPITVTRLKTPQLFYNNVTNVITKADDNKSELVFGYLFTHNDEIVTYDFNSAYTLSDANIGNEFTLTTLAVYGSDGQYYLNSLPCVLSLQEIANTATISLDGLDNNLVVVPAEHVEKYNLVVEFNLGGTIQTFSTKFDDVLGQYVLSNGLADENEIVLNYTYSSGRYVIELIDENHNAIIEEMNNEFTARVRFVKPSTGNDLLINSKFSDSVTLNLNRIDGESEISVNAQNQIVVEPAHHNQEFALVGVMMISDTFGYIVESNGESQLICNKYIQVYNGVETIGDVPSPVGLDYEFKDGKYYINVLNENYELLIPGLTSNATVKVKYSFAHNGVKTDLDSEYSASKTISIQPVASISREGQKIKIQNVKDTYTYQNYSLLINNYPLLLDETAVSVDGYIVFDVEYIYSKTPDAKLQDINFVEVVVKNNETTIENPVLATKGGGISVKKTETVELNSYKFNNNEDGKENNSAVVVFNTYTTQYAKEYIVEIQHDGKKVYDKHYLDSDAVDGVIEFDVDDIAELSEISGQLNIFVYVTTSGSFIQENVTIEMFNSKNSNLLGLQKLAAPTNLSVDNSTLKFNAVQNAVGYEVYEKTGVGYTKLNTALITTNSYDISNFAGAKTLVVKAISIAHGFSNSTYSEIIAINKLAKPSVSVVNGKFKIQLNSSLLSLLLNDTVSIVPEISNGTTNKVTIDLNEIDGEELVFDMFSLSLIAEPYLFLSYNNASLKAETLSVVLKIQQTEAVDGVYYLNADPVNMDCHGLFEPTKIKKTTKENNSVEMISWDANEKNVIDGNALSVGYIFKIEYSGSETPYYSDDENLKYYDKTTNTYVSYPKFITETSAIFPAGYGLNDDGSLQVKFEAGTYKMSVQSVPQSTIGGYNLLSSKYSASCEFEIMPASTLTVEEGKVTWEAQPKADHYVVSIFEQDSSTALLIDEASSAEYDFSNKVLDKLTGVYKVVVKAISIREDTLNSAESEPLYVYRLPQATAVTIDDGNLILSTTPFFTFAEIELVDSTNTYSYFINCDNSANIDTNLESLNVENWISFDNENLINSPVKYAIKLDGGLNILEGRDYTINVKLIGNSHEKLGLITSVKAEKLSNLTANKLKANVAEVNLGVVKFMPDQNYATISSEGVYTPSISLNYDYNLVGTKDFWNTTAIYKIVVKSSSGDTPIYAVDYYSFITAVNNNQITADDYILMNGAYGLHACVKYSYTESAQTKTLYFNVYQNNEFNLRDYEAIYYYPIIESIVAGVSKFECVAEAQTLDLSAGGNFSVNIYMLGGDSFESTETNRGYFTSPIKAIKMFHRYGDNKLTSLEGQVQFNNLTSMKDGDVFDYPVYKLLVKNTNDEIINTYYFYHTSEEEAKQVAARHDPKNYEKAIYLKVALNDETNTILYDMAQDYDAGSYLLNLRTLAGLGVGDLDDKHYLINAPESGMNYPFHKLSDTQVYSNQGVLEFKQSYIISDGSEVPYDDYEITLFDHETNKTYVYDVNGDSEGIVIDETRAVVQYVLPKTMNFTTESENVNVAFDGGRRFSIKVRAIAKDNYILNGTYKQINDDDYMFEFEKSKGVSDVKVEDGILKWKVLDLDNYQNTYICVSFEDENFKTKSFKPIAVSDLTRHEVDGVYQYHYYQFTDGSYTLSTSGSMPIKNTIMRNYPDGPKEEVVEYKITLYTSAPSGSNNIINSNISSVLSTTRLSAVDALTIKTENGVLVWNEILDAVKYEVYLTGTKNYQFTTTQTSIDFLQEENLIDVGIYDIQIRAIGSNKITAMMSTYGVATGFVQLDAVDFSSIKIQDNKIVWNSVENADKYKVLFKYTDLEGKPQEIMQEVIDAEFVVPEGTQGKFTIVISAISDGSGKEFNGKPTAPFTSSSDTPVQVEKFEYDEANMRLVIDVKAENFLNNDEFLILYNMAEYTSDGIKEQISKHDTISYMQAGSYVKLDDETYRYYYPLTTMGQYTNISVQVTRPGTVPSNAVSVVDIDLHFFEYGAGTFDNPATAENEANPYRIANAEQLLNIARAPSANYVLVSAIDMSEINVVERLKTNGAIIANEFSGVLEGSNFSIFGFNIDSLARTDTISVNNVENFALFNTLDGATIKNLTIGSENIQLILLNTFASSSLNMVNLSLIATGANNSILDNVDVFNFKMILNSTNSSKLTGNVNLAGLIVNSTNSLVTNSTINFTAEINIQTTGDVYVGGVIANAHNANINDSNVAFTLNSSSDNMLLYVGGAIAYFEGNTAQTAGITKTEVTIAISNVKSVYVGGLVGFARYIKIAGCSTSGTYSKTGINYETYVGGLVGLAQSSIITMWVDENDQTNIKNSGSTISFNVAVSSIEEKYFGAIAGSLTVTSANVPCKLENCYMNLTYQEATSVTTSQITLGLYGYKDTAVIITGCHEL